MPFLSASYANFRNLADGAVDLCYPEVFLVGANGQGKSNILESLYMSAYGASFRTKKDCEISKFGTEAFSIRTAFRNRAGKTDSFLYLYSGKKKRIEKNSRVIADRKELVSAIPCILFSHDDMDFVSGSPERKRFFVDQSLSMYDVEYISVIRKYKKILKTRNAILKERGGNSSSSALDVIDIQFAMEGLNVIKKRKAAVWSFAWIFSRLYEEVSGISNVSIAYIPSWKQESPEEVIAFLSAKKEIDFMLGSSASGPHRDKIMFMKDGTDFVPTASMGQRRLLALILRVSQAVFYTRQTGNLPVFLMDDVLLELDPDKRKRFTAVLPEYDQLFCTFLLGEPYDNYRREKTKIYEIREGAFHGQ